MAEPPKSGGKGDEPPKSGGKDDGAEPPKSGGKGLDAASDPLGAIDSAAVDVFRRVASLGGLLVVSFITPIEATRSRPSGTASARRLALSELRRKAELRQREDSNARAPDAKRPK